eukprot:10817963-Heterocapsa_arctica.AAC.1
MRRKEGRRKKRGGGRGKRPTGEADQDSVMRKPWRQEKFPYCPTGTKEPGERPTQIIATARAVSRE